MYLTSLGFLQELNALTCMKMLCSYKVARSVRTNIEIKIKSKLSDTVTIFKTTTQMQDIVTSVDIVEIITVQSIGIGISTLLYI